MADIEKADGEMAYWIEQQAREGRLMNGWYQQFYTDYFGLTLDDYAGKRVLDIGCGPRGSLEWATTARQRVGLDPLADRYLELGAAEHDMEYCASGSEAIPFPDGHFDIVCSFNSLDHVDSLEGTIDEIKRVTAIGGLFLLLVDVHRHPTPQEPILVPWTVPDALAPHFAPQSIDHYEKPERNMYSSVKAGIPYDHSDTSDRYGILSGRFVRVRPAARSAPSWRQLVPEPIKKVARRLR